MAFLCPGKLSRRRRRKGLLDLFIVLLAKIDQLKLEQPTIFGMLLGELQVHRVSIL